MPRCKICKKGNSMGNGGLLCDCGKIKESKMKIKVNKMPLTVTCKTCKSELELEKGDIKFKEVRIAFSTSRRTVFVCEACEYEQVLIVEG